MGSGRAGASLHRARRTESAGRPGHRPAAVQRRGTDEHVLVFKVANGRRYDLASEAEVAAEAALTKVREVSDEGELIWEENAI